MSKWTFGNLDVQGCDTILPHGTFLGVGIGGHYTHGGYGYSSRRWVSDTEHSLQIEDTNTTTSDFVLDTMRSCAIEE
jgi:hypothetical protein